jgi:hypothetical protein
MKKEGENTKNMEGNRSVSNKELGFKGVVLLHVVHSTIK